QHRDYILKLSQDEVLEAVVQSVTRARNLCGDVEWSAQDATRTEPDFLYRCVEAAINAGARTINLPDTVGYSFPEEYAQMFRNVILNVPNADKAIFSAHCHNDLGLAVANSIAAVQGGARQIECAINGIGERAGNAALEEIVMALKVRGETLGFDSEVDPIHITRASRYVSAITGFPVQFNKAIVGKNAFLHESGIHQDGVLKNVETFEIMRPEDIGLNQKNLTMGKHSGRAALRSKLKELGYDLADNQLNDVFIRFKALADRKKEVYDDDLIALVADEATMDAHDHMVLKRLRVISGTDGPQEAEMTLAIDGVDHVIDATGDGPVDAAFNCVKMLFPHQARLQLYQVAAVTEGTDAQATVTVRLEEDGRIVTGQSADTDTIVASTKAYVNALNKLVVRRQKTAPDSDVKSVHYAG
ncbi:MAG: 2-isopropylmalate synthase, partial [Pseudomonadota bacterium]